MTNSPGGPAPTVEEKSATVPRNGAGVWPTPPSLPPQKPGSLVGQLIKWAVVVGLSVAAWQTYPRWKSWVDQFLTKEQAADAKPKDRVIPVLTARVDRRDMPLYLNGLGTVTALKTVTVRSRVEGELVEVAFEEGQVVKEGDLLARIDPRPFERLRDQAKGSVARDQATLNLAKLNLERQEELLKSNATTTAQYDTQVALVAQAEAALATNQAVLETAELQLEYCRITAPISGRVGLRLVDKGNMVRANDPNGLVVITQLDPIGVVFTIPQDEIPRVQKQFELEKSIRVDAFDRSFRNKLAEGKLVATDNQVDPTTGTLRLKASFKNETGRLFPNQFVNARLAVETLKQAFVVPSAAIQRGPEGPFVYVAKEDNGVEKRMVVPGPSQGTETSIQTGLSMGEIVVTDGVDKLHPAAKISFRDPNAGPSKGDGAGPGPATARDQPKSEGAGRPVPVADKGKA